MQIIKECRSAVQSSNLLEQLKINDHCLPDKHSKFLNWQQKKYIFALLETVATKTFVFQSNTSYDVSFRYRVEGSSPLVFVSERLWPFHSSIQPPEPPSECRNWPSNWCKMKRQTSVNKNYTDHAYVLHVTNKPPATQFLSSSPTFFTMVVSLGSILAFFASEPSLEFSVGFTSLGFSLKWELY